MLSISQDKSALGVLRYYSGEDKSVLKGEIELKDCVNLKQSKKDTIRQGNEHACLRVTL